MSQIQTRGKDPSPVCGHLGDDEPIVKPNLKNEGSLEPENKK